LIVQTTFKVIGLINKCNLSNFMVLSPTWVQGRKMWNYTPRLLRLFLVMTLTIFFKRSFCCS